MKTLFRASLLATSLLTSLLLTASAQTPAAPAAPAAPGGSKANSGRVSDEETKDHWWDCSLPGGNYTVSIGKITSVSMHQYIVKTPTQAATALPMPTRVYEVNIATDTAMVTRFYYMETATDGGALSTVKTGLDRLNEAGNQAADRTGTAKYWQLVQKDYPLSTHAHTIEFRLESLDDLNRLFGSVKRCWMVGRGARFSIVNQ
jgi:hypothetical protein